MTSYVNSYVEKTHLLRPPLGDVRNQPIKRLMAPLNYDDIVIKPINALLSGCKSDSPMNIYGKTSP